MTSAPTARANRRTTLLLVLGALALFALSWPDAGARARAEYVFVLALGYGHLVGAAWMRWSRGRTGRRVPLAAWEGVGLVTVAAAFAASFAMVDWLPVDELLVATSPLLALSVWHTVENDLALAGAYGRGLVLGPIPRESHLGTLGGMGLVMVTVVALSRAGATFGDVFTAATLYHLFQWLVFLRDRIATEADPARRAGLVRGVVGSHGLAALACAGLVVWRSSLPPLAFEIAFSPSLYLCWSALHVVQTARARAGGAARHPLRAAA